MAAPFYFDSSILNLFMVFLAGLFTLKFGKLSDTLTFIVIGFIAMVFSLINMIF